MVQISNIEAYGLKSIDSRPWKYRVDESLINPSDLYRKSRKASDNNRKQRLIGLNDKCVNPESGKTYSESDIDGLIEKHGGKKFCRLVYFTRHGQASHNREEVVKDKTLVWAVGSFFREDLDPQLTGPKAETKDSGWDHAEAVGRMIDECKLPNPQMTIASDLLRAQQTAVAAVNIYGQKIRVVFSKAWREFQGPFQYHVSDGRLTLADIRAKFSEIFAKLSKKVVVERKYDAQGPRSTKDETYIYAKRDYDEQDTDFATHETYINVDIRAEKALNDIFDSEETPNVLHIVTHGRVLDSVMRVLGYNFDKDAYRSLEFENGATIAVLVKRKDISPEHQKRRQEMDEKMQREELAHSQKDYLGKINQGFNKINDGNLTKAERSYVDLCRERLVKLAAMKDVSDPTWRILSRVARNRLEFLDQALNEKFQNIEKLSDLWLIE